MKSMRARLFLLLGAFALVLGVCSRDIRPAFASSPYEGDSSITSTDGLRGVNTSSLNGGLGVHGMSGSSTSSGAGVKGEDSHGGWGVWGTATGGSGAGYGVYGNSADGSASVGVRGDSGSGYGVFGYASGGGGKGVAGYADANAGYAVYGYTANNGAWAGYFSGSSRFASAYASNVVQIANTSSSNNWPALDVSNLDSTPGNANASVIHAMGTSSSAAVIFAEGSKYGVKATAPSVLGAGAAALWGSVSNSSHYALIANNTVSGGIAIQASTGGGATGIAIDCVNAIRVGGSKFSSGVGSPNSVVTGVPGDVYTNQSGGAGATWWVKESGSNTNTGWVAK